MIFKSDTIRKVLDLPEIPVFEFNQLGLSNTEAPGTLSFLDDEQYLESAITNKNITALFVGPALLDKIPAHLVAIACEDPRWYFFTLFNYVARQSIELRPTIIDPSANISERASIEKHNVVIGKNVVVEPNVTILSGVEIGDNCVIRAGAVIGSEGFEVKRTKRGLLPVVHDGRVILESNVEIGANCTIDKGVYGKNTFIGAGTKFDNLVHVAHNVKIGKNCLLIATCCILGSVTVGDDVWLGPGTLIRNGCTIGDRSEITMGSIITKDVAPDTKIVGKLGMPKMMTY